MNTIINIPLRLLHAHPGNPRKELGDLTELSDSIRSFGIMQNLTVVPYHAGEDLFGEEHYTVIAGHRRRAAAELAGLETVPCIVTELSPLEQMSVMMTENLQREELTPIEQAQGFQLMIDLGADVDQIAEKTGMSKRRVRARLEISRLDQQKLNAAMKRHQVSLAELEKMAKIEDMDKRNSLIDALGTYNFNYNFDRLYKTQEAKKVWPELQRVLREAGAKKIKDSEKWSGEYDKQNALEITDGAEKLRQAIQKLEGEVFYWSDFESNSIWLYTGAKKKAKEKRPKEEIEREARIKKTWEEIDRAGMEFYRLRREFMLAQAVTKENREAWIRGALTALCVKEFCWGYSDTENSELIDQTLGLDGTGYGEKRAVQAFAALRNRKEKVWPGLIYAMFTDSKETSYVGGYRYGFPRHKMNVKLDALYELLEALGYHMCDAERAMFDGSHELLHRGEDANA